MTRLSILVAVSGGVAATAATWVVLRPPVRLAGRVRPYVGVARARLLRGAEPGAYSALRWDGATWRQLVQPVFDQLARLASFVVGQRDEEQLALRLRQSGLYPGVENVERLRRFRHHSLPRSLAGAAFLGTFGWLTRGGAAMALFGIVGFIAGAMQARGRIDQAVTKRRHRMQSELYTVNQILAMRARAGGGVVDSLRHVAARGRGTVVGEIKDTLQLHRSGIPIAEALRRTARNSAEPEAGRLYRSLATAQDRGVDLADALLALARDLRVARRDEAVTTAARRRIAAVLPLVVILGPIAIALLAAPLPGLIFGGASP